MWMYFTLWRNWLAYLYSSKFFSEHIQKCRLRNNIIIMYNIAMDKVRDIIRLMKLRSQVVGRLGDCWLGLPSLSLCVHQLILAGKLRRCQTNVKLLTYSSLPVVFIALQTSFIINWYYTRKEIYIILFFRYPQKIRGSRSNLLNFISLHLQSHDGSLRELSVSIVETEPSPNNAC